MFFDDKMAGELGLAKATNRHRELALRLGRSFVHNDYLALSSHPRIIEAGIRALLDEGAGSRGSRLLGGHSRAIADAESYLADFFGAPSCLFFPSGYQANLGVVRSMGELSDHIVSDERNHASLIDAISLARRPKTVLPHQQWESLPEALRSQKLLLVSESLFSMDGDFVRWDALRALWKNTDSFLVLDEAHAIGVFREEGRGFVTGIDDWERIAVVVTFGKAFGVAGAAVLGSERLKAFLVNRARTFIYTTAPSPAVPAMVCAAASVVAEEGWRRRELWDRSEIVRAKLRGGGVPLPSEQSEWERRSPIVPVLIPGDDTALRFCESMRKSSIELRAIRYPTVPKGGERARLSLSLVASREETLFMADEVVKQWTAFSLQG